MDCCFEGSQYPDHHGWDGKSYDCDNIFVERLWRTVKHVLLYTKAFNDLNEVRQSFTQWFDWYNQERFHQNLDHQTSNEVYYSIPDNSSSCLSLISQPCQSLFLLSGCAVDGSHFT
jgi:putative transposase